MYPKDDGQISLLDFLTPLGRLHPENRWVKMAELIPWREIEEKYAAQFCEDNGAPAKPLRMALGTLLIQRQMKMSDEETIQIILKNAYMQYFIGLREFTDKVPFTQSTMVNFRKRLTTEVLSEINEMIYRKSCPKNQDDNRTEDNDPPNVPIPSYPYKAEKTQKPTNKGKLLLDATCVPSSIRYPTNIGLLNEAREKLESMIDALHPQIDQERKPRTYRRIARRVFLGFIKNRKPGRRLVRRTVKKQLGYVARDLIHIETMLEITGLSALSAKQRRDWEIIRKLFAQQKQMYQSKSHSCPERIVSISQPFVRPIVRGKANAPVEFGTKVSISLIDGFAFVDRIGWEPYCEAALLRQAIEVYHRRNGCYPEAVLVDQLCRNRDNRAYCKERNIRISGPLLGRPPKD